MILTPKALSAFGVVHINYSILLKRQLFRIQHSIFPKLISKFRYRHFCKTASVIFHCHCSRSACRLSHHHTWSHDTDCANLSLDSICNTLHISNSRFQLCTIISYLYTLSANSSCKKRFNNYPCEPPPLLHLETLYNLLNCFFTFLKHICNFSDSEPFLHFLFH